MSYPIATRPAFPYKAFFDLTSILLAVGWLLLILGLCLLLPTALSALYTESTLESFLMTSFCSIFVGGVLVLSFSGQQSMQLRLREGFLLTIVSWVVISFFSALPFYLSGMTDTMADAIFEAVSSLTTTGISVLQDVHYLPQGARFWRIFLQWLGGFGIILMAVTLLPLLKIGGAQLMTTEFSDRSEKIMPRTSQIAAYLMGVYISITGTSMVLLMLGHLSFFDALYYSMSSISTGGIIVADQPLTLLSGYCKGVLIVTMVLGGSTLMHLVGIAKGHPRMFFQDDQIRCYYRWLLIISGITVWWIWNNDPSPLINGCFMAVSAATTTGYGFGKPYDSFLTIFFLMLCTVGGCSGSTTGGLKVFRLQILYRITRNQLLSMLKPYGLFLTLYNRCVIEEPLIISVVTTVFFYIVGWLTIGLGFALWGHSVADSLGLSASLVTNSGLALTTLVDHMAILTTTERWLAIFAMLCGRLEFITLVTVMLIPFWHR